MNIHLIAIYRPPPSKKSGLSPDMFLSEFATFLEEIAISPGTLLIVGDLNFHIDDKSNVSATKFMNLLDSFNLIKHVTGSMHRPGHTSDLVLTRPDNSLISNLDIYNPLISDHEVILFSFGAERPNPVKKDIQYRSLKKINFAKFCQDISSSALGNTVPISGTSELTALYNTELTHILDDHAPLKSKLIYDRNECKWFTNELGELKKAGAKT